ncbi:MAG: 2-hydroxy-3-oxopropionate reductase [Chloroflexi bacterium]|nr:2-hydroxy-3-oxopropionate reductase [Chloroflexota bacterium]
MQPTIGFIGLGIMGKPMARNLVKAGYSLVVHDRVLGPVEELLGLGATRAASAREVAQKSDLVITMLPDSPDVDLVVAGKDGVLEGIRAGTTLIDMSTISPVVARALAAKAAAQGIEMLDAPVSGGDKGAISGTLSIMVGGKREIFDQCLPIFQVMGKNIVYMGEAGAGQVTKACNQIVVGVTLQGVAEALTLGAKAGVDPAKIIQALSGGLARCGVLELRGPNYLSHTFQPGFRVRLHHKDLSIAMQTGAAYGVPLPATSLVREFMNALITMDRGDLDHSALITLIEDMAGIQVRAHETGE